MTAIDPLAFPEKSESAVYELVNTLAVDYLQFAQVSHYYNRLYGVLTGALEGGDFDKIVINQCLREEIYRTLFDVQEYTEKLVGYNLTERFHSETIDWPFGAYRITRWPGLKAVNVQPSWSAIEGYGPFALNPFVIVNPPTESDSPHLYIELDKTVVSNPNEVILRRGSDYGSYTIFKSYRPTRLDNGNWQIEFDQAVAPLDGGEDLLVQHTKYVYLDVDPPATDIYPAGATLHPVYPGTTQKIPLARPTETLDNGKTRYWFFIYSLVDPAFYNDTVDLVDGEFYKLFQTVEIKAYKEAEIKGELQKICKAGRCADCGCDDATYQVTVRIKDAEKGIVYFEIDGELVDGELVDGDEGTTLDTTALCPTLSDTEDAMFSLTFYYQTSPDNLDPLLQKDIPSIAKAIIHRAAADLPLMDCGCETKSGFIYEQQKAYGTTYSLPSGEIATRYKYGDLHGHKVYAERLANVSIHRSSLI